MKFCSKSFNVYIKKLAENRINFKNNIIKVAKTADIIFNYLNETFFDII